MSDKRLERYTSIDKIRSKGFYENLLVPPFDQKLSNDFKKFPNQLLNQIASSLDYVENMQDLIQMMKVSDYAHLFVEFNKTYDECQRAYEYWVISQQQEYERLIQQQQVLYQNQLSYGNQNQFGNQGGFSNQYNQSNYQNTQFQNQNYPNQNYGNNQGYPNQNYGNNQGYPNQNYGNNQGYHNKGHHHNQNFENQGQRTHYNKQRHDNYNNGQRTYNQNHQGKYGNYNQNNQNQYGNNQNNQNYYNRKNNQNQFGTTVEGTGHRKNYQHYNNNPTQVQEISHIPQVPVQQIKKIIEVPKPQKPELKPVKFTLLQLKGLINSFNDKENQNVNKNLIAKVQEVKSWKQGEVSFDEKQERQPQFKKNNSKRDGGYNNNYKNQGNFNKGKNYTPTPEQPDGPKKDGLSIVIGKNQTLETKLIKQEIKGKAGQDFATIMEQQQSSLSDLDKAKKQIIYNLNLLAPENIKDIQKDLTPFLFENKQICEILIQQIIEKAWGQPKYASTYAKLCQSFSKIAQSNFKFQEVKQGKTQKNNPFKRFLISTVQHSFDKKVQKLPQFKDNEEQQNYLKQAKKKILGNMKFIAELIRSKILKKQIMKICMSQLISAFLSKYENFKKTGKIQDSYYDYYFEALIQFTENVGDYFQKMDKSTGSYEAAEKVILDICDQKVPPPKDQISQIGDLTSDQYFKIFAILDSKIIRKINSRLSALLQNLEQRRANGWVKHHAEGQGPKKLKDIKEDIAKQEEQMNRVKSSKKASLQHLNELVKVMFKDWENVAKNQRVQIKKILKEFSQLQFFSAFLSQVADQKKQNVAKRVQLFDFVLDEFFNENIFKNAWLDTIKGLAFSSSDFPFCGAALAKILIKLKEKKKFNLADYYLKTTDQDEEFFMNEVYDKMYHYTNWEQIKQFTEPSKKVSGML